MREEQLQLCTTGPAASLKNLALAAQVQKYTNLPKCTGQVLLLITLHLGSALRFPSPSAGTYATPLK